MLCVHNYAITIFYIILRLKLPFEFIQRLFLDFFLERDFDLLQHIELKVAPSLSFPKRSALSFVIQKGSMKKIIRNMTTKEFKGEKSGLYENRQLKIGPLLLHSDISGRSSIFFRIFWCLVCYFIFCDF